MLKEMRVKPALVKIDRSYQRPLDEKRADTIAEHYNPERVGVPVLSQRKDGHIFALDGQHRIAAIVKAGRGETPILCLVHDDLTVEQEAGWFIILNGDRIAVDAMTKYRARVVTKEPVALDIRAIAKSKGLSISYGHGSKTVSAIHSVEWVHKNKGNLAETLDALIPWAQVDERALDGILIKAVSIFLAGYPDADLEHLAKRLTKETPATVMLTIKHAKRDYPTAVAHWMPIRAIYNKATKKQLAPLNW
jgi:hypothetical protein